MDEFANRLKADAANIEADISTELTARIEASIRSQKRDISAVDGESRPFSLWWTSSLTGLVAAVLVIVLLNRNSVDETLETAEVPIAVVVPEYVRQFNAEFLLRAENADFTEPLEDELAKLKLDMAKVRENVRQDLRSRL